jgi:hypothetical protein
MDLTGRTAFAQLLLVSGCSTFRTTGAAALLPVTHPWTSPGPKGAPHVFSEAFGGQGSTLPLRNKEP